MAAHCLSSNYFYNRFWEGSLTKNLGSRYIGKRRWGWPANDWTGHRQTIGWRNTKRWHRCSSYPGLIRFLYWENTCCVQKCRCKKWMRVTKFLHGLWAHCLAQNCWMLLVLANISCFFLFFFPAVSMIRVGKSHRQACEDRPCGILEAGI